MSEQFRFSECERYHLPQSYPAIVRWDLAMPKDLKPESLKFID
jgi:hypothetical protein